MNKGLTFFVVISVIILIGLAIYKIANDLSPGSYPFAEKFEFGINEKDLAEAVEDFKISNSTYILPKGIQLKDGRKDSSDYWYHIYFYYPEENQIVKTWIRQEGKGKSIFAFVGINEGVDLGNWKLINKDFTSSENQKQIRKFKERILDKIEAEIDGR